MSVPQPVMPSMVCKSCRLPLTARETWVGGDLAVELYHSFLPEGVPEHTPEPVMEGEVDQISVCDFCRDPGPRWTYPAKDFLDVLKGETDYASMGNWAACTPCKELIEADDYTGLLERAVVHLHNHGIDPEVPGLRGKIEELFANFKAHRNGEVVKEF